MAPYVESSRMTSLPLITTTLLVLPLELLLMMSESQERPSAWPVLLLPLLLESCSGGGRHKQQ